jgi:hypothetical protein
MGRKKTRLLLLLLAVTTAGWCIWTFRRETLAYYHAWCWWYGFGEAEYHRDQLVALGESAWPAWNWWLHRATVADTDTASQLLVNWLHAVAATGRTTELLQRVADSWPGMSESVQASMLQALYVCATSKDAASSDASEQADGDKQNLTRKPDASAQRSAHAQTDHAKRETDGGRSAVPLQMPFTGSIGPAGGISPAAVGQFLLQVQPLDNRSARLAALQLSRWVSFAQEESGHAAPDPHAGTGTQATEGSVLTSRWWQWCRQLAEVALSDDREEIRCQAVRLAALPQLELKEKLARRLLIEPGEPAASVRALLLIAVGDRDCEELAPTESLARWLHDESHEVRKVCEQVLRTRGLTPQQIQLARMWTDPDPLVRIRVPQMVYQEREIDPVLWLERLSRDTSPAVRAAVIRAAGERMEVRFSARLAEMAQQDTSTTVRQLAEYYQREMFAQR